MPNPHDTFFVLLLSEPIGDFSTPASRDRNGTTTTFPAGGNNGSSKDELLHFIGCPTVPNKPLIQCHGVYPLADLQR
jgi:hypothetical protein